MFEFNKNRKQENFDFHIKKTWKMIVIARDGFVRADGYTNSDGSTEQEFNDSVLSGTIGEAREALLEAMCNADEAIRFYNIEPLHENKERLSLIVNDLRAVQGYDFLVHPDLIENWDNSISQWLSEYEGMLVSNQIH